jgi:hypothetical protein
VPDTPTTRLGMYKSASDGSEDVDYSQDIGQNLDLLDAAVGFQIVTSSTRPSSPYAGKPIAESDTSYRTFFSNGTSPASGSWVEIPNSSGSYGGNLNMALGTQLNIGGSLSTAAYACRFSSATGDYIISGRVVGDSASRSTLRADGQIGWGPGNASTDTFLARSGSAALTLTGSLTTTGAVSVGGNLSTSGTLTTTGNTVVNGVLTAKNRVVGSVSITPSAANTPTSQAVVFPSALTGSTFYGVACAATTVPGTQVTGIGITSESSTGCTIYVTRTNTTATIVRYIVEGF